MSYDSPDRTLENSEIELEIVWRVNSYRRANGLTRLAVSSRLNAAADLHSLDMMEITGRFGPLAAIQHQLHGTTRPQISDRLDAVGYDDWTRLFRYGENIALGYATADARRGRVDLVARAPRQHPRPGLHRDRREHPRRCTGATLLHPGLRPAGVTREATAAGRSSF